MSLLLQIQKSMHTVLLLLSLFVCFNTWPKVMASPFWIQRLNHKSFQSCHSHMGKGSVVPAKDDPIGSWKIRSLLRPCQVLVGWLWTVHSFIRQAFYGISTRLSGDRLDARITKMNRTLSLFLRSFLFRVWIQTHKPVCSEKRPGCFVRSVCR